MSFPWAPIMGVIVALLVFAWTIYWHLEWTQPMAEEKHGWERLKFLWEGEKVERERRERLRTQELDKRQRSLDQRESELDARAAELITASEDLEEVRLLLQVQSSGLAVERALQKARIAFAPKRATSSSEPQKPRSAGI